MPGDSKKSRAMAGSTVANIKHAHVAAILGPLAVAKGPGASRLRFHGVQTVKEDLHPKLGRVRINLTLRRAL